MEVRSSRRIGAGWRTDNRATGTRPGSPRAPAAGGQAEGVSGGPHSDTAGTVELPPWTSRYTIAPTGHAEGEDDHCRHADQDGDGGATERRAAARPVPRPTRPAARPLPRAAPSPTSRIDAKEDQDQRERAPRRRVEADGELGVRLGRQRAEAEDFERTELGQADEGRRGPRPPRWPAALAPPSPSRKSSSRPEPEAAGDLLLGRVSLAQAGRDGKEHQGVDRQGHQQDRGPEPADRRGRRAFQPKLTTKSGIPSGMTTRTAIMRRPGNVSPLDEPRQHRAHRRAHYRDHDREADGVAHQFSSQVAEQQGVSVGPARLDGLDDEEHERGHHRQGDEGRPGTRSGGPAACPGGDYADVAVEPGPLATPATLVPASVPGAAMPATTTPSTVPLPAPSPMLAPPAP